MQNLIHANIFTFKLPNVFLDCEALICDFRRGKASERWLNPTKNGARMVKDIMLCKFRRITRVINAEGRTSTGLK